MIGFNVLILAISVALASAGASMVVLTGGIIGTEFAPSAALSTLPVALMTVGTALATIPASMLMRRFGRRNGFIASSLVAATASLGAAFAIYSESFFLFCLATMFIGANLAFSQQYRFAAAESVTPDLVSKAISFVLLGGIVAGFIGPEIAKQTRDWLPYGAYSGSFVSLAAVYVLVALLFALLLKPLTVHSAETDGPERPLRQIVKQPGYGIAVLSSLVGYSVMSFIMTATPISMHVHDGHSLDATARVIQSHAMAMFLPSLFTGTLIARLGLFRVLMAGILTLVACIAVAISGHAVSFYWVALVLLGIGWNFLFVGGTVLLTQNYRPTERFKAQATNDFTVFAVQASASLAAGQVIHAVSWERLNLLALPLLLLLAVALVLHHRHTARASFVTEGQLP